MTARPYSSLSATGVHASPTAYCNAPAAGPTTGTGQRNTEALLKIQTYHDVWNVRLVLFGVHLVLIGYLAYTSGYVPRVVGVLLVIGGAGYLVDSFAGLLIASYSISVAEFTFVGEALLIVWLLAKGRNITLRQ